MTHKKKIPACIATLALFANPLTLAHAENAEHPLTLYGITLYGTLDAGVAYQNHGAPFTDSFGPGMEYMPQKSANNAQTAISNNGMSQSSVGLKGKIDFDDQWAGIFNLQTAFDPVSGQIADHLKAMTQNNGVALNTQTTNADSSLAGQVFNGAAWFGLASSKYGEVKIGRISALTRDDIVKHDPLAGAYAFSPIGFSGLAAGAGATEDARLNNAITYSNRFDRFRVAALYANASDQGGVAWQGNLGADLGALSVDALYATKKDALFAAPLGIAGNTATSITALNPNSSWLTHQATWLGQGYSFGAPGQFSAGDSLAGTAADLHTYGLMANYTLDRVKLYGGYENIRFSNPSEALNGGYETIGGYYLAVVNNGAYTTEKNLGISWIGAKYAVTPQLDVIGAYYRYDQGSYHGDACSAPAKQQNGYTVYASSACSAGTQNTFSLVADYRYNSILDLYAGVSAWTLTGGLASGFINTSTVNVMTGARVNF